MTGVRRSLSGAVAVLAAALLFQGPAQAAPGSGFQLIKAGVTPKDAIPHSLKPARIHLRFRASQPLRVAIRIKRLGSGQTVRRIVTGRLGPRRWHHLAWDGRTQGRRLAPEGRYLVVVGPVGGPFRRVGRLRLHGHLFPVAGPHGIRGAVGEFGAGRTGGRTHEGFDVTAACGTPLVAVRSGTIIRKANDPELKGHYVVLKGEGERRTYLYAHLLRPAPVREGQKVRAGRRLGSVGQTGNAASTPCHLHIEIRTRGRLLNPQPLLNAWDW